MRRSRTFRLVKDRNYKEKKKILSQAVFSNADLVQYIMEMADTDPMQSLEIRCLNRAFNIASLNQIRKKYKNISIYYNLSTNSTAVNRKWVRNEDVHRVLRFLEKAAHVKVEKMQISLLWDIRSSAEIQRLHLYILQLLMRSDGRLKTLFGMDEVCAGCIDCCRIASECDEYGPMQSCFCNHIFDNGRLLDVNKQFRMLKMKESELWHLCYSIVHDGEILGRNQQDDLQVADTAIRSNFRCDNLVIIVSDYGMPRPSYPVEILHKMVKRWNVKSLGIEFDSRPYIYYDWNYKNHFYEFRFDERLENVFQSFEVPWQLELMTIQFGGTFGRAFQEFVNNEPAADGYSNLFHQLAARFPTNEYHLKLPVGSGRPDYNQCMNLFRSVANGNPPETLTKVFFFTADTSDTKYFELIAFYAEHHQVPLINTTFHKQSIKYRPYFPSFHDGFVVQQKVLITADGMRDQTICIVKGRYF